MPDDPAVVKWAVLHEDRLEQLRRDVRVDEDARGHGLGERRRALDGDEGARVVLDMRRQAAMSRWQVSSVSRGAAHEEAAEVRGGRSAAHPGTG